MPMLCLHRSQYDEECAGTQRYAAHLLYNRLYSRAEMRGVLSILRNVRAAAGDPERSAICWRRDQVLNLSGDPAAKTTSSP